MTRCAGIGSSLLFRAAFKFGAAHGALDDDVIRFIVDNDIEERLMAVDAANHLGRPWFIFLLADIELGPLNHVAHSNLMLPAAGTPLPHRPKPLPPVP